MWETLLIFDVFSEFTNRENPTYLTPCKFVISSDASLLILWRYLITLFVVSTDKVCIPTPFLRYIWKLKVSVSQVYAYQFRGNTTILVVTMEVPPPILITRVLFPETPEDLITVIICFLKISTIYLSICWLYVLLI